MTNTHVWVNHGLPFRPAYSSTGYVRFMYEYLPTLSMDRISRFSKYQTAEDVKADPPKLGPNPIGAEWRFDLPGMILYDRGCDMCWSVDGSGQVFIPGDFMVAFTLPEFLARFALENSIWWDLHENDLDHLCDAEGDTAVFDETWASVQRVLSEEQLLYLRSYYYLAKRMCRHGPIQ